MVRQHQQVGEGLGSRADHIEGLIWGWVREGAYGGVEGLYGVDCRVVHSLIGNMMAVGVGY